MADLMVQARDLLVEIARKGKRFRHDSTGYINESELARALGMWASTVHRILHVQREPAKSEWFPRQQLLRGIAGLTPARNEEEALEAIREADPQPLDVLKSLIRPPKRRRKRRKPLK